MRPGPFPRSAGLVTALALLLMLPSAMASPPAADEPVPARYKLLKIKGRIAKWGMPALGANARVSYAFLREGQVSGVRNCKAMAPVDPLLERAGIGLAGMRHAAEQAFARWSSVAGIVFERKPAAEADILIGTMRLARGIAFTDVRLAQPVRDAGDKGPRALERSLICLDPGQRWTTDHDGDPATRDLAYVLAHEIGHAIGLDHPGRRGALMAYAYDENGRELTEGDIAAIRRLYGPRPAD